MKAGARVDTHTKQVSNVVQEFSRFAHQYDKYNMIQAKVASELVEGLQSRSYARVVDIGCGNGSIFKNFKKQNIVVDSFIAMDSAQEMLNEHPQDEVIVKVCTDFNEEAFVLSLVNKKVDLCISSSALQWSVNLDFTLQRISEISGHLQAAIFTSGTFKTLHATAGISSPIYTSDSMQETLKKYYKDTRFKIHQYKLEFKNTREMFKYIKQSGVSGGERRLSYKQMKQLMLKYPLDYLEFEVLFVEGRN